MTLDELDGVAVAPTVLYRLSGSQFVRRDEHGGTLFDSRADPGYVMPRVSFNASLPRHTIENTGDDDLVMIGVELKRSRTR